MGMFRVNPRYDVAKKKSSKARTTRSTTTAKSAPSKSTTRKTGVAKAAKSTKAAKSESTEVKPKSRLAQKTTGTSKPASVSRAAGNGQAQTTDIEERPILTEAQLRKVKTGLTKKDLLNYRQLLLEKRAEIVGDVTSMEGDARNNSGGNLSSMPMHMADIGSDNYEQEFTLGLVESERKLLREIDDALMRIHKGIYGVCLETGVPIARARLDAKPWAKYCIEVAREKERLGER